MPVRYSITRAERLEDKLFIIYFIDSKDHPEEEKLWYVSNKLFINGDFKNKFDSQVIACISNRIPFTGIDASEFFCTLSDAGKMVSDVAKQTKQTN